jgi:8-oxo-dGTP pyrophosphatase MutT (NUDIX family)
MNAPLAKPLRQTLLDRLATPAPSHADRLAQDDFLRSEFVAAGRTFKAAAVLILIVERSALGEPAILLTQRTEHLQDHAGQISFPGGRIEPSDASAVQAALRETAEETGVDVSTIEILGSLTQYFTGTGYEISPIIGYAQTLATDTLRSSVDEVAEQFLVPLSVLLDARMQVRETAWFRGRERAYWSISWREVSQARSQARGQTQRQARRPQKLRYIWGATAGMLVMLRKRLEAN